MSEISNKLHAFELLELAELTALPATVVVLGDDRFLKRLVLDRLMAQPDEWTRFSGESLNWRDLADELATRSLFSRGPRCVLVEDADSFVTRHREDLERQVTADSHGHVLLLDLQTFPTTTNLYKRVVQAGWVINCRPPESPHGKNKALDTSRMRTWLLARATQQHHILLAPDAFDLLIDLTGWDFGMLDQELAKLALYVEPGGRVSAELVQQIIGGWRVQTTWEMMDAATEGNVAAALTQLDHLLRAGEAPQALFGSIAWSLRRFATATRIHEHQERLGRRPQLQASLEQAGFRNWPPGALVRATTQLKQLGRHRAHQLHAWLLEADLALKGSHSPPSRGRFVLERLFLRLARQASR